MDSSTESPVHVLMLSIQPVRGLPRLRAPGIVPCIISFPGNSLVSSWCDHSMPASLLWRCLTVPLYSALLRTQSFAFFAVHETRNILLSPFISKSSRHVSSFFLRVQLSLPYVATGHTSAFFSRIFVEMGMLWLFNIFYSNTSIACPLFNLVRNSVVHSLSLHT